MPDPAIIAIGGENLIDQVHTARADGSTEVENNPGGSPFNVAIAVARQDGSAHYLTPISTDAMGDLLADRLMGSGVHLAAPRRPEPTSMAIVTLTEGIPTYAFHRDGTAERCVTQDSIRASIPDGAAAVHIGSLALIGGTDAEAWEAVCTEAAHNGLFLALDPNLRPSLVEDADSYRARLKRLFRVADLIKLSDEDIAWIYPDLALPTAFKTLRSEANAALVVLTKGPDGAEAFTDTENVSVDAPPVPGLKDTIGAGDTFMGTLLATLGAHKALSAEAVRAMDKVALDALIRRAAQAAALNCAKEGCDPPTLAELDAAMAKSSA